MQGTQSHFYTQTNKVTFIFCQGSAQSICNFPKFCTYW